MSEVSARKSINRIVIQCTRCKRAQPAWVSLQINNRKVYCQTCGRGVEIDCTVEIECVVCNSIVYKKRETIEM